MGEVSRRSFVKSSAAAGVALSADNLLQGTLGRARSDEPNDRRPNVVLICADMAAAKHFGCYGDPAKVTPNVDALAQRGVRFDQAKRIEGFRSELLRWLVAGEVNRLHPVRESHYPVPTIDRRFF